MWIGNKPPRTKSPALWSLLRINGTCNSQEDEAEEDKAENEENNIKVKFRYESRCVSREALMTVLLCLTPPPFSKPFVLLVSFIHCAVPSPVPPYGIT